MTNPHDFDNCGYCQADVKFETGLFQMIDHWMYCYPPEVADMSLVPNDFKAIYAAMENIKKASKGGSQ